jgi:hypothetical protein
LAIFQKTMIYKRQDAYDEYQEESARLDADFTINAAKNVTKNYKLRTRNCFDTGLVIKPNSTYEYVVIQPNDGDDGEPFVPSADTLHSYSRHVEGLGSWYYDYLFITPKLMENRCDPSLPPPQVPFVLGARGIIFRRRSTPYFTTLSNPEAYIE